MASSIPARSVESRDLANGTEDEENDPEPQIFTLEILQIIKEAQQQHGLRHGDYQRYRSYCSRRLRRIRRSLHFPQGSKHRVHPKKITQEILKDVRFLQLPLFSAERAWSYTMQLKAEANTKHRIHYHMVSRMKKAVQHSDELAHLCESPRCDARTKLEAQGYNAWLKGALQFELENWRSAIEFYSGAKTIYEKLASAFTEDLKDLYLQRVEEVAPNIRYCAYNIGDESAIKDLMQMRLKSGEDLLTSRLDQMLSQTREKQASTLSEVNWRERLVPVKNEQVRIFLLNFQESSKQLGETLDIDRKISVLESLLKQLIDAQQVLRDSLHDDVNFKAASRGQPIEGKISNQHYLHSYLTYLRLTKTIERNLLLIDKLVQSLPSQQVEEGRKVTKPQDLVRLYDIIIQNLNEIPHLPGLEDGSDLSTEISAHVMGFKAFKSFCISLSYSIDKKWREAICLHEKVLALANKALDGYQKLKLQSPVLDIQRQKLKLEDLMKEVSSLKYSCHASSILDSQITNPSKVHPVNNKPLSERFDQYVEDPSLAGKRPKIINFPPDFKPIPCRPLFFDLALNHISFPSLDSKLKQKQGAGITGMVKGWLWGGKT